MKCQNIKETICIKRHRPFSWRVVKYEVVGAAVNTIRSYEMCKTTFEMSKK